MNLTIAMRVIGGFAITSTLLLFLGMNSVSVLNGISASTSQVNNISVPALDTSAKLQQHFVQMSKTTLIEYYATTDDEVQAALNQFQAQNDEFDKEISQLKKILANAPMLAKAIPSVSSSYEEFKQEALTQFDSKHRTLELADAVQSVFEKTEMAADDASVAVIDFVDFNDFQDDTSVTELTSAMESSLLSVLSAVTDISKEKNRQVVDVITKELSYTQNAIAESLQTFQSKFGGSDLEGYDDVIEYSESVLNLLNSRDSVQNTKKAWLDQIDETKRLLNETNEMIETGLTALKSLVSLVEEELTVMKLEVTDEVNSGVTNSWIVIVVSLILSIFIAFQTVIRVTRPLAEVNRILNTVATGDLTTKLDDSSKDEFGTLAKNCNTLIDSLRDLINGIVHRSNQLATASEQTSMVVKESTMAINDQRSQVEQAATATTEMASTSEAVMDRANEALDDIKHADEEAERVKEISNINKQTIIQLAGEVESASTVIDEVNQHSASIGGILDVIRGVAEQTNLLALNAAIEAARAGEQGRGFAVVADEVRSLASKTQESTEEIQSMIEQLQRGSKSAVTVMNNSKNQAELCVEQSELAAVALEGITDSVHQANDMSEQIVTAAREQNQVSSEISERLESIVAIAEQTAAGASQTELSSQEVAKLAEALRLSVDQFKL